ncbi:MAG: FtsX-like permease family protein, partial [Acidobacteria bacterium]|nr:FtsX-like permease family protein [Acidobacteriota bacterium]
FRIPVIKGRTFDERDNAAGAPVVIINQAMARQFWPNGDPMNDRILIGKGSMPALEAEQPRQIVGIIGDVRDNALNADPQPRMFIPISQQTDAINALNVRLTPLAWVVRTHGNPATVSPAIQEVLRQVSGLPLANVRTMDEIMARSTSRERFNMLLMMVFGFSALFLAAIGVYGLMAYSVQQRTQEIGIRLALGAQTGDVRRMVIVHGMKFAVAGILVGTGAAWWAAAKIANFLFQVTPRDPAIFTTVPLFLIAVALAAVWVPALRATRVDPVIALRAD